MFSQRFKALRKEKGLTQKEIGELIGVSSRTVGYYESNERFPNEDTLKKISSVFNVSIDYLLGHSNSRNYTKNLLSKEDNELPEDAIKELESFKEYLKLKYGKKGQD